MIICYGISKKTRKGSRRITTKNGKIDVPTVTSENWTEQHAAIRDAIATKHPGWSLIGYAPKRISQSEVNHAEN